MKSLDEVVRELREMRGELHELKRRISERSGVELAHSDALRAGCLEMRDEQRRQTKEENRALREMVVEQNAALAAAGINSPVRISYPPGYSEPIFFRNGPAAPHSGAAAVAAHR